MNPEDNAAVQSDTQAAPQDVPKVDLKAEALDALSAVLDAPKAEEEAAAAPAAEPAPAAPAAADKPAEPAAPAAEKPVDEEIAELGLKEKSAARFRELAGYKTAIKEAGIEPADLPNIVARAKFADDLESAIVDTGATPEQYGAAIRYLALVNGGPDGMLKAYEVMQAEMATLAKALGKEAPGVHDPLAEFPDLREDVENGDMTRKRALEIAEYRARGALVQGQQQQAQQQQAQQAAVTQAVRSLDAIGARLKSSDPQYAAKVEALQPAIALIRERCPPSEWAAQFEAAYARLSLPAYAAPQPAAATLPPPGPVRAVAPSGVVHSPEPRSAMEALEMGLAMAKGA